MKKGPTVDPFNKSEWSRFNSSLPVLFHEQTTYLLLARNVWINNNINKMTQKFSKIFMWNLEKEKKKLS